MGSCYKSITKTLVLDLWWRHKTERQGKAAEHTEKGRAQFVARARVRSRGGKERCMGTLLRSWAPSRPCQASRTHSDSTKPSSLQKSLREVSSLWFCFCVLKRQEQNPLIVTAQKRTGPNCIPWAAAGMDNWEGLFFFPTIHVVIRRCSVWKPEGFL